MDMDMEGSMEIIRWRRRRWKGGKREKRERPRLGGMRTIINNTRKYDRTPLFSMVEALEQDFHSARESRHTGEGGGRGRYRYQFFDINHNHSRLWMHLLIHIRMRRSMMMM